MKINIAGAGAGKTTKMAEKIISCYKDCPKYKNIYCITFTNNASNCIIEKLTECFSSLPDNIKVSTIHSFLYNEIIKPYYYILYQQNFDKISTIKLDNDPRLKKWKMGQLENSGVLHIEAFTEKAKWVLVKKSKDKVLQKTSREVIINNFSHYCCKIFVDEAQDIDRNLVEILKLLTLKQIDVELMGDPKQDLKGYGSLQSLILDYQDTTNYINSCFRCPQNHLELSNSIIPETEWQISEKNFGEINVVFEKDIDVILYISHQKFDLKYISQQNDRYGTHENYDSDSYFNTLFHEIYEVIFSKNNELSELLIKRIAYSLATRLINEYKKTSDAKKSMRLVKILVDGNKQNYARIINALEVSETLSQNRVYIKSIDAVKGQEGSNCLFVLTPDLSAYLFKEKIDNNKIKNRLYVALTRSLDKLSILITKEVEDRYGRSTIIDFFENYL